MTPRRKQALLLGGLLGLLVLLLVKTGPSGSSAKREAPRPADPEGDSSRRTAASRGDAKAIRPEDIPDIDPSNLSRRPERIADASRDLFRFIEPPPVKPKPKKLPPPVILAGDSRFIGPLPAPPPPPPPEPPQIPFQFTGTFGPARHPLAVIIQGDRLTVVRAGDVIDDRFVIRKIGYESIEIGFVGFPETKTRRLPITASKASSS